MSAPLFAAIEAGGTKFVCGLGSSAGSLETSVIPTTDVATTVGEVIAFLDAASARHGPIDAIGIGSFGPIELDPAAAGYGRITTTPKPGWSGADVPAALAARYGVPIAIDTDVNAAALAEARLQGVENLVYVTVGTGIGAGIVVRGQTLRGRGHPECGHIAIARHPAHRDFAGVCPYHGDCLEGMASGPAMIAAWGTSPSGIEPDHPGWDAEADYLGQLCASLILTVVPDRIVFGGGVMKRPFLLPRVREAALRRLAGYCSGWDDGSVAARIVEPLCVEPPGLVGSYLLAEAARAGSR